MSDFSSLGLASELAAAAAAAGFDEPTPLQSAAIPVLRRGGNVALVASSGAGVTAAWALGLLDRLYGSGATEAGAAGPAAEEPARPRALVVTASDERASKVARTLVRLADGLPVPVRALNVEWSVRGGEGIVAASIGAAVRAIRGSILKLDRLEAVIFEQVSVLRGLESETDFDALVSALPSNAQRIVTVAEWSREVERFVEAHVRRALTIPARTVDLEDTIPPEPAGTLTYMTVAPGEKPDALARILRRKRSSTPYVSVRSQRIASEMVDELVARGFNAGIVNGEAVDVVIGPAASLPGPALIACDVPFDAEGLAAMDLSDGLVLVEPGELAHLRSIAASAAITLQAIGARPQRGPAAKYREEIRRAIAERDIDANVALLEPLFESHSAVEIAAALSALLRDRRTEEPKPESAPEQPGRPTAFVRLFVSAGTRDNIRAGDLVGAITGEASVKGEQIGKIELRDTFSVVEVAADVADRVIRALNGTTLRGRSLRVDFDRKGAAQPPRPQQRGFRPQRS